MAKFNLSRFNRAKYNRQADGAIVFDKARIDAVFLGQFGLGQKTIDALQMTAAISGRMQGAAGTLDSGQFDAIITHEIAVRYIAYGHDTLAATIEEEIHMAAVIKGTTTLAATFLQETYLSPEVRDLGITITAAFGCDTYLGNKIIDPNQVMAYGIFNGVFSAEALEEISMELAVTLQPGDILVIDSDNFRVLLNGENAIKYHSGDWIDELNRMSKSITVSGGGSALETSIYFQELWL